VIDLPGGLDLLADGSPVRAEVRAVLAGWNLGELAAAQVSSTGYPDAIWQAFRRQLGPRLNDPEVARIALEEVGAARCPLPVHAGLVQPLAAATALGAGGRTLREALLERVDCYALALPGPRDVTLTAERGRDSWRLSGSVRHLTYGDSADVLLVPARAGRERLVVAVVPAGARGLRRTTRPTLTSDRLTDAEFDGVDVDPGAVLAAGWEVLDAAQLAGTLAIAAELVGMGARLLELTADRVTSRHAFGAPLAALQGVQLRAADMYLDFLAAREAVVEAASLGTRTAVCAAKVTATQSALAIAAGAHQLCGGWGLLDVAGLHHYTRAIKAAESRLGSPREHRAAIADQLRS
jgi:alkylation response protein AidB-like acyl-CoA dehydrogenase